jgi:hypothetical protein
MELIYWVTDSFVQSAELTRSFRIGGQPAAHGFLWSLELTDGACVMVDNLLIDGFVNI